MLNRGDAKAYAAQYVPDADRIDSFGRLSKGRENIEQAMQEMLTGPLQGATFVPQIHSLRFLADNGPSRHHRRGHPETGAAS